MLVTYFDEVKYQRNRQPFYWLAGISVTDSVLKSLEEQVAALSETVFGTRELLNDTEFHASDILNGHAHFEGWKFERRIETLKQLISIFGSVPAKDIGKIYCKIDVERMVKDGYETEAFMFFAERVELYLRGRGQVGIIIGDRENDVVSSTFAGQLSQWRSNGTYYQYGIRLENLIDTVHFTHSHHSRMLQLADLHVWLRQLCSIGDMGKWHRRQIICTSRDLI